MAGASDRFVTELRDRLQKGRQPVDRDPYGRYDHPRGGNDALNWVELQIKDLEGAAR